MMETNLVRVRVGRIVRAALLALPLCAAQAAVPEVTQPRVALRSGELQGSLPQGAPGAVFEGIPFAQPPLGSLRWHEPVPPKPWPRVKHATAFGAPCVQMGRDGLSGAEDCLYLNVWTPAWPARAAAPVMLWLFGGANTVGSAGISLFDGSALARYGMVVVTANYRVGVMGFMAHPALSAESPHQSSGNYALLDQIMALRWIRQNIGKFGGDPRHVTLFGQSSGSYDLMLLMTSPLAKGLFVNAIAQSGQLLAYNGSMSKARAQEIGVKIAAELEVPGDANVLASLRALPAAQVVTAATKWLRTDLGSDTGLLTNVDGWLLPEPPARAFAHGHELAVPLIIGNNAREITSQVSPDELRREITAKYGDLAPEALAAYGLADGGEGSHDPLLGGAGSQWMTDIVQRCAAIVEADWHAAHSPTWQYQFERAAPGREAAGATHGAEVPFVFGNLDGQGADAAALTSADYEAAQQIQEYWTRFAKTGNPNGGSQAEWPRAGSGHYLAFTATGPMVKENLRAEPCRIYREWRLREFAH